MDTYSLETQDLFRAITNHRQASVIWMYNLQFCLNILLCEDNAPPGVITALLHMHGVIVSGAPPGIFL